ncbi:MAG: endonuclease/exonuclease/phosphatase family protein [Sandaracinaceae bacterium]|nr:endonuclease/exonuclease/phosphatase family protein [Sandaracinaceae bacterium]
MLRRSSDRRWLEVRAIDGARGWITARYVAPEGDAAEPARSVVVEAGLPRRARGAPARQPGRARFVSWNLRWFPDGSTGGPSATPTDVEWAACILATLRADVVALQEIVLSERGRAAVATLARRLGELTGGRFEARFDRCPRDGRQHVGWLVDVTRARILAEEQLDDVNPEGGCSHHLRPGHALYLRFARGLDLSAVVVHLDSGQAPRDSAHRRASFRVIADAARRLSRARRDGDVLVLGDLNTMGCSDCAPRVDAAAELAALDAALAPALRRVAARAACTELYHGEGTLLDHALSTVSSREVASGARVEVHGPCAQHRCHLPRGARPPMLDHLSDHCPIAIELDARDLD